MGRSRSFHTEVDEEFQSPSHLEIASLTNWPAHQMLPDLTLNISTVYEPLNGSSILINRANEF